MFRNRTKPLSAAGRAVLSSPFTEQELQALLIGSSDVVLVLDRQGHHRKVACIDPGQLVGAPEAMLGKRLEEVLPSELAELGHRTLRAVFRDGRPRRIGYSLPLSGGERYFETLVQPVDEDHVLWIARDVTDQRATAAALARRYEATTLLNRTSTRLMDLPPDRLDAGIEQALAEFGRHFAIDCAYIYRLGADGGLINSHSWPLPTTARDRCATRRHVPAEELPWVLAQLHERQPICLGSLDELPDAAETDRATLAARRIHSLVMAPIFYSGALRGLLGFEALDEPRHWRQEERDFAIAAGELLTSALQRHDGEEALFRLAYYDSVTGLPNRQRQIERLRHRLSTGGAPFGVALHDLDDSRLLNDIFGHELGDLLLRRVADRLQASLAAGHNLCRWGSDEFMLTVPAADAEAAIAAARHIQDTVATPIAIGGQEVRLSCCLGTAHYSTDGTGAEALVRAAETALGLAKQRGRGSLQRFLPQLREEATRRSLILSSLRRTLDTGGFSLAFQPQFCLHRNAMVGVEALLRLDDPELGPVAPDEFIPIAEENGLISQIGDWVVREACREVAGWPENDGHPVKLAINVSPQQLLDDRLLRGLSGAVREHRLSPTQIELEITESMLVKPDYVGVAWLRRLREAGFGIAVDDFGTGYSSLGKLKHLPTTALKIDRSFIRDLLADGDDRAIVRAIIAMAHQIQLQVVAEGVETPGQLAFLRENGCDLVQGFLYAKPQPASDARRLWVSPSNPHLGAAPPPS